MSLTTMRRVSKTLRPWLNTKTGTSLDFNIKSANGSYIYDKNNNPIIDFTSGLMVTNLGHNNKYINNHIKSALKTGLTYFPPSVLTTERERLSERLVDLSLEGGKVFYTNGGADANEAAIYFAKHHFRKTPTKSRILRFNKSFHGGSTYVSSLLGGDTRRQEKESHFSFELTTDAILPNPSMSDNGKSSMDEIEYIIEHQHADIAAILIEGSSGTAGCYVYPKGYYTKLEAVVKKHDILLIVDEVMSGCGRTGKMFAHQHEGGNPDIITLAKGITNGCVPMGATIVSERISDGFKNDSVNNGLTYSGHPLACAAANACLDLYDNNLFNKVTEHGKTLARQLNYMALSYPDLIKDSRGSGMLHCVEFYDNHVSHIHNFLLKKGVYTFFRDNNLYIAPPLTITACELHTTLDTIDQVCMLENSQL